MSGFYSEGLQGLLERSIPSGAAFYVIGVSDDYVFNAAHDSSNINPDSILMAAQPLAGVSMTNGILNAEDTKWFSVQPPVDTELSATLVGVVIYLLWNAGANGALLAYIDSTSVGLPTSVTGVNLTAEWAANGILKL